MKLFEITNDFGDLQKFIVMSWGKLLYINYLALPKGKSQINNPEFHKMAKEYLEASEDKLEELDEWISDGAPLKNGTKLLTIESVDDVLHSCERPLKEELTLYRFGKDSKFKANSWISMTTKDKGYPGKKHKFVLPKGTKVIDTDGLADKGEYIVSTNVLNKL